MEIELKEINPLELLVSPYVMEYGKREGARLVAGVARAS